jgi:hypothetical protein
VDDRRRGERRERRRREAPSPAIVRDEKEQAKAIADAQRRDNEAGGADPAEDAE